MKTWTLTCALCCAAPALASGGPADMVLEKLESSSTNIRIGDTVTLTAGIYVRHNSPAFPPTSTAFVLSTDRTISSQDRLIKELAVPLLYTGRRYTVRTSWKAPASIPSGIAYFGAIADYRHQYIENDKDNNKRALQCYFHGRSDLVVARIPVPQELAAGATTSFDLDVRNNGGADSGAPCKVRAYLSKDRFLDGSDLFLGESSVPNLLPLTTNKIPLTIRTPSGVGVGLWRVLTYVDATRVLRNENTANNTTSVSTRIYRKGSSPSYGNGCAGSRGVVRHDLVPQANGPMIGENVAFRMRSAAPRTPALLALGLSRSRFGGASLPLRLDPLGARGCSLFQNMLIAIPSSTSSAGVAVTTVPIPARANLVGFRFYTQYLSIDALANAAGLATTNGLAVTLGGRLVP